MTEVSPSQPTNASAPDSFDVTWRNGAYYVSVPNYQGGTVYTSEYVESLRAELASCRACRAKVDCLSRTGTEPQADWNFGEGKNGRLGPSTKD